MKEKIVEFPTENVSLPAAIRIVTYYLDEDGISIERKIRAIQRVSEMETMNSIKKDTLKHALRWMFEHYDFS